MKHIRNIIVLSVVSWGGVTTAWAAPDAANAAASTPSTQYQSPFRDYRPLGKDKLTLWKAANEEVGKIGGWRVYARDARDTKETKETSETREPAKAGEPAPGANIIPDAPGLSNAIKPLSNSTAEPKSSSPSTPSAHPGHREPK